MRILIIVEETASGYSAYSPDVPGCVAAGDTREEVETRMREAMTSHLELLRADGEDVPKPRSYAVYVDVAA